jgi:hypothetical protein
MLGPYLAAPALVSEQGPLLWHPGVILSAPEPLAAHVPCRALDVTDLAS